MIEESKVITIIHISKDQLPRFHFVDIIHNVLHIRRLIPIYEIKYYVCTNSLL